MLFYHQPGVGWQCGEGQEHFIEPVQGKSGDLGRELTSFRRMGLSTPPVAPMPLEELPGSSLSAKWECRRVPTTCFVTHPSLLQLSTLTVSTLTGEGKETEKKFPLRA